MALLWFEISNNAKDMEFLCLSKEDRHLKNEKHFLKMR